MGFRSEDQLFRAVIRAFEKLTENPVYSRLRDLIEDKMIYVERQLDGQRLYFVGETHYSRKPVEHTHKELVPKIRETPQTWLILREVDDKIVRSPLEDPVQFYFQELAKLSQIPYEAALSDLWSSDTRKYIKRNAKVSEEDIDRFVVTQSIPLVVVFLSLRTSQVVEFVRRNLEKSTDYTLRLLSKGTLIDDDLEETIVRHWNDCSRLRFHKLREKYPDRSNILVSAGYSHLPAFE